MMGKREDEKLVDQYGQRLLRSAFLLCGNENDAHDLTQETLFQAIKSFESFRHESSVYTWLYGILLNLNRRHCRRKERFSLFSDLKFIKEESINPMPEFEKTLDQEKLNQQVYGYIKSLSRVHREVIILRYFEVFSVEKMAVTMGVSTGTIKSRLHYATRYLRKKMAVLLNLSSGPGTK